MLIARWKITLTICGNPPNLESVPISQYVPMALAIVPVKTPNRKAFQGDLFSIARKNGMSRNHEIIPAYGITNATGNKTPEIMDSRRSYFLIMLLRYLRFQLSSFVEGRVICIRERTIILEKAELEFLKILLTLFLYKLGNYMRKRKAKQGEKIYLIKATVNKPYRRIKGSRYRVLAIPEGLTLYKLAEAMVDSFDFYFDHCFGFYDNIKEWIDSVEGYELFADIGEESRFKGVEKTKVKDVFDKIGKKMLFLFDYGDNWHFIVELTGFESPKEGRKYPFVVESVGNSPPQYG